MQNIVDKLKKNVLFNYFYKYLIAQCYGYKYHHII